MATSSLAPLRLLLVALGVVAVGAAAGCSIGGSSVEKGEVEKVAATELAAQVGADELPKVVCPDDLDAEVGATMTCELTPAGDDSVYPVEITVTSVDGGDVKFDVEVEDTAIGE